MQIKRYKGRELPDVVRRIREDLGPDAVILHTRTLEPRGVLRFVGGAAVEVLAARDARPEAPAVGAGQPSEESASRRERPHVAGAPDGAFAEASWPRAAAVPRSLRPDDPLADLRDLVLRLGGVRLLTPELIPLHERLVAAGVDDAFACAVLRALPRVDAEGRVLPPEALEAALREALASMVPAPRPPLADRAPVVALVGPPGAGKTTTLAKLAARARMAGTRVEIASLADGGLGAPSPLEPFAAIVGARYTHATRSADLEAAAARVGDRGMLLIDTPPLAAGDAAGTAQQAAMLRAARPTHVHLVLPATIKPTDAAAAVRACAPLGVTDLLWTRLDETATAGSVLGVTVEVELPPSYFGTGPEVPADLETATARGLVDRVLDRGAGA